jgi:hypothetical protein
MIVNEQGDAFQCDCGFSWRRGHSGSHDCDKGLRSQREDLIKFIEGIYRGYIGVLESGRSRIVELGGQCDEVEVMVNGDQNLRDARALIEKYKGGA